MWLGRKVVWERLEEGLVLLDVIGFCDAKPFYCAALHEVNPTLWKGTLVSENPPGLTVVVRPTVENDTARGNSFLELAPYPLPLDAVRDMLATGVFEKPELHTVWDADEPVGLHLYTGVGTYLRGGGTWHELHDASVVADLEMRSATRSDLIEFDKRDELLASVTWPPVAASRRTSGETDVIR